MVIIVWCYWWWKGIFLVAVNLFVMMIVSGVKKSLIVCKYLCRLFLLLLNKFRVVLLIMLIMSCYVGNVIISVSWSLLLMWCFLVWIWMNWLVKSLKKFIIILILMILVLSYVVIVKINLISILFIILINSILFMNRVKLMKLELLLNVCLKVKRCCWLIFMSGMI